MSTSESSDRPSAGKGALIYLAVSVFCFVFFLIYDRFSHGVHSPYMTYLFAWPLALGLVPCLFFLLFRRLRTPAGWALNLYNAGVASLTVSSLLRGIFEIAGTSSSYQAALTGIGILFLAAGILVYLLRPLTVRERPAGARDTAAHEAAAHEATASGAATTPGATAPETATSETGARDTAAPGATVPEAAASGTATTPGATVSEAATSGAATTPGATAHGTTAHGTTAHGAAASGAATTPGATVSEAAAHEAKPEDKPPESGRE